MLLSRMNAHSPDSDVCIVKKIIGLDKGLGDMPHSGTVNQ